MAGDNAYFDVAAPRPLRQMRTMEVHGALLVHAPPVLACLEGFFGFLGHNAYRQMSSAVPIGPSPILNGACPTILNDLHQGWVGG